MKVVLFNIKIGLYNYELFIENRAKIQEDVIFLTTHHWVIFLKFSLILKF